MIVTIPSELEQFLSERATQLGTTTEEVVVDIVRSELAKASEKQRVLNIIRSGKYALPSEPLRSDQFAREKAEEIAREERRWNS